MSGITAPSCNPGVTGLWRDVDYVYGTLGRPVSVMVFTAANGSQGRLMACQWSGGWPPTPGTAQTFETDSVTTARIVKRPSGQLDLFYATRAALYHRASRDDGATWGAATAQTVPGVHDYTTSMGLAVAPCVRPDGVWVMRLSIRREPDLGSRQVLTAGTVDSSDVWTWASVQEEDPLNRFGGARWLQANPDGLVTMWPGSRRVRKISATSGAFTIDGVKSIYTSQPAWGNRLGYYAQVMQVINSDDPLIGAKWEPVGMALNTAGTEWAVTTNAPLANWLPDYRSAGGLMGEGGCLRMNRAHVWEFLAPDDTNTLLFRRCRAQDRNSQGAWA